MSQPKGAELRRRREALGMTLEQVSGGTGLTRDALSALESDEAHRLTRGAYGEAYRSTYALFLDRVAAGDTAVPTWPDTRGDTRGATVVSDRGADTEVAVAEREPLPPPPAPRVPLPVVRALAATTTLFFIAMLVVGAGRFLRSGGPAAGPPTVVVKLKMQRNVKVGVLVDGVLVQDREFAGREEATFSGRTRVEVNVPSVDALRVWFNGRPIDPRGQVGTPRSLVFLPGGEELR